MDGILLINKEQNWTSFDCIAKLRKIFNQKKIGHSGTLDPFAEGLLIVCLGKMTKLIPFLEDDDKEYIATLKLGEETDTLDKNGIVISRREIPLLNNEIINEVLKSFLGKQQQTPPMYSALKYQGKPLYFYMRNNIPFDKESLQEIKRREIEIKNIELLDFKYDQITFKVLVSKGTYIRSLGKDIANKLNTNGHLISLKRTKIGNNNVVDSKLISKVTCEDLIPIEKAISYPKIKVENHDLFKAKNGQVLSLPYQGNKILIMGEQPIAIYFFENGVYKIKRGI